MLRERPEVGIVARVIGRLRPLRGCLRAQAIVASQCELVEELVHCMAEILAGANTLCNPREGLGKPLASGRVGSELIGACGESLCHA